MTVLEKKATRVDVPQLARYVGVALLAGALGVGIAVGGQSLVGNDSPTPASIAATRAGLYAEHMQNTWIAQVNATRSADMVARFAGQYGAHLAALQSQRAAEFAASQAGQFAARVSAINEQRAEDMATFKYGWEGEPDS
ncbi:MAG: hypothetical protein L0Z49_06655 [Actinobacteria bacterium]|nr:hypothetical protein [Actinomycetota bacterium]MCI0544113.1 hypothetical protein [Actinomycetota bacterium]MCI0677889.1 hypothetical protein [Actinomycetota bacterium]